jgi:LysR family transcriptional regulator, nitrogen assimilation regulatory protein
MTPPGCQPVQGIGGGVNALTPVATALTTSHVGLPEALTRAPSPVGALELRELRYFAAAARTGNLGRAAQDLNVTPPAISQQLRKLEDELGTQLLIRHSRGVTPTPAGARLLERIDAILHLLNAPLDPEQSAAHIGATVSLAMPAEIGALLAAPLVAQVRRRWPGVALDLREDAGAGIEARLLGCEVDIGVLHDPPDLDKLRIEPLLTEGLGLVMAPSAALARSSSPLRLRDLAGVPLILPNPRHWTRRLLARAGFQRGVRFDAVFQVDSVSMTKEMIRAGLGSSVMPGSAVRDELARGALVFRPLEQPTLSTTYSIGVRCMAAPVVRDVAQVAGEVIRSLAASGTWPGALLARPPAQPTRMPPEPDEPPETWRLPRLEPLRGSVEFVEGD